MHITARHHLLCDMKTSGDDNSWARLNPKSLLRAGSSDFRGRENESRDKTELLTTARASFLAVLYTHSRYLHTMLAPNRITIATYKLKAKRHLICTAYIYVYITYKGYIYRESHHPFESCCCCDMSKLGSDRCDSYSTDILESLDANSGNRFCV